MKVCERFTRKVEEKIEKPMDKWVENRKEKCKKGKWYNPFTWLCWFVTALVLVVRWVVVTVIKWVAYVVCKIVKVALSVIGMVLELLKSIPILGAIINILHNVITFVVNVVASLIPALLDALGYKIKKYLRVTIIIQRNEKGDPLTTVENLRYWVEKTKIIYKQANVEALVEIRMMNDPSPNDNLEIAIQSDQLKDFDKIGKENMGPWMGRFRRWMGLWDFEGAGGRLLGIGASLVCYIVEDIKLLSANQSSQNKLGYSWGPMEDFIIVINDAKDSTLAHEIGHSCLLSHNTIDELNLMFTPNRKDDKLNKKQIFLIRNSKYVSMF